ncbi:uncharacterized protein LOC141620105 [Silene latifolia]|uniref:uncharacterized protein LOC141620105 n=1 Tax=Silene latifolia TaxID=37657 RepID=UPI003D77FF27
MIFTRGDVPSVTAMLKTLQNFSQWSGLHANTEKTDVYFGGVSTKIKAQILLVTGFSEGQFPFRYLGLPLNVARNTTTKSFSYAGKVQLLNSVIFGLTNFWGACVILPKSIIKIINKLCKDFFWNSEDGSRRMIFKSWKSIYTSWNEGGFDIRELLSWNKALVAKRLWLIIYKQTGLWFTWTQAYNFPTMVFWDLTSKDRHSESLKSIITVNNEILQRTGSQHAAHQLLSSWTVHGKFNIDMAYNWFRTAQTHLPWAQALKHQFILPSHSLVTSLAVQQQLATVDNLIGRGMIIPNRCILYKQATETHDHLFFSCPFSHAIWTALLHWLDIDGRGHDCTAELLWSMHKSKRRHWKNGWLRSSIAAACYYIWEERNARIFKGRETEIEQIVYFKYQENGTYIATIFDEAHNHPLASPESTIFLKGNRKMTEVQKQFITKVKVLKLGGVKAYRGWKELCGGYDNIGATEVNFKNFVRDIKT